MYPEVHSHQMVYITENFKKIEASCEEFADQIFPLLKENASQIFITRLVDDSFLLEAFNKKDREIKTGFVKKNDEKFSCLLLDWSEKNQYIFDYISKEHSTEIEEKNQEMIAGYGFCASRYPMESSKGAIRIKGYIALDQELYGLADAPVTTQEIGEDGFVYQIIDDEKFLLHELIWEEHHNKKPKGTIIHIDGNKLNNTIKNLKEI